MAEMDPSLKAIFGMQPTAAIAFLKSKGLAKTWDFDALEAEAHNHTFTVAKAMRLDILQDIRNSLVDIMQGQSVAEAKKALIPELQRKGWWGKQEVVDTNTGEIKQVQLGSPARVKTVIQTNLQSAFMNARMDLMKEALDTHPYWQWVAIMDRRTRPAHGAMNGRVFKGNDAFFSTVAKPPCGYNCRCRPNPISEHRLQKNGLTVESTEGRIVDHQIGIGDKAITVKGLKMTGRDGRPTVFTADYGWSPAKGAAWQAPFTPKPLSGVLPRNLASAKPLPALPTPTAFAVSKLLASGLPAERYVAAFLAEFDATLTKPVTFFDVTDEPLTINDSLFRDKTGAWKVDKNQRAVYLPLLAEAIKKPDEIWLYWQPVKSGQAVLRRRYIKQFVLEGQHQPAYAAFDEGRDGWVGVTSFQVDDAYVKKHGYTSVEAYIQDQRRGYLLYSRKD